MPEEGKNNCDIKWLEANKNTFATWDAHQLATYLRGKADLGAYYEVILEHKVTGEVAPRLTDNDLKEMGIVSIGDRKRFSMALDELKHFQRKQQREQVLWTGEEQLYHGCWDGFCKTCCGCCPDDPSEYSMTGTHLIIKTVQPQRCGPIKCCCVGAEYKIDNIDLTYITDADVKGDRPPCTQEVCCCAKSLDVLTLKTSNGEKVMKLHMGEGETVSKKILNQVEEAQQMERD